MLYSDNWSRGHGNTHRSNGSVMNAPMGGQFRSKNETKTGWDSLDDTDLNTNPAEQTIASTAAGDTSSNIPGSVQIEIYNNGKNSRISSNSEILLCQILQTNGNGQMLLNGICLLCCQEQIWK